MHTGQHYDRELSQVFFEELELGEPRYRLEVGGLARRRCWTRWRRARSRRSRRERPDWVLVYGDTNSTLGGARAASEAGVPLAHVEAGLRSDDLTRCPRSTTGSRPTGSPSSSSLLTSGRARSSRREGVPGRVEVVGDVMADANLRLAPLARERSTILEHLGVDARGYVVATLHREANVAPAAARADSRGAQPDRGAGRLPGAPAHSAPRSTDRRVRPNGLTLLPSRSATSTSPRSRRRRA